MYKKAPLVLWVLMIMVSACTTIQSVPIEQLEAARVNLPSRIEKVAVLSRNFKFSFDTLQNFYTDDGALYKLNSASAARYIDSLAVTGALDGAKKRLNESEKFAEVITFPYSFVKRFSGEKMVPLSRPFVNKVCNEHHCQALISLEMISYFFGKSSGDRLEGIPDEVSVKINAIWALYLPESDKIVDRYTYSDNLLWNNNLQSGKRNELPPREAAVAMAAVEAANRFADRLLPHWVSSERKLLLPKGDKWINAAQLARENRWDAAALIWKELANGNDKKAKYAAEYNISVALEMVGKPDLALEMVEMLVVSAPAGTAQRATNEYLQLLKTRKAVLEKISK